jgi:hypothetical protein
MRNKIYKIKKIRAIPDFKTEEGKLEYAHLIGLPELPDYVHTGSNGCFHDDARVEQREARAREVFRNINDVKEILNNYFQASRAGFSESMVKPHRACPICKSNYMGAYNICPVCAHVFRSEKMIG